MKEISNKNAGPILILIGVTFHYAVLFNMAGPLLFVFICSQAYKKACFLQHNGYILGAGFKY